MSVTPANGRSGGILLTMELGTVGRIRTAEADDFVPAATIFKNQPLASLADGGALCRHDYALPDMDIPQERRLVCRITWELAAAFDRHGDEQAVGAAGMAAPLFWEPDTAVLPRGLPRVSSTP